MKNRPSKRLIGIALVLFIFIGVFFTKDTFNFLSYSFTVPYTNLNPLDVNTINIQGSKETVLTKHDGIWFVDKDGTNYRADQNRVNTLIESILNLKKDILVTSDTQKYHEYGVDNQHITLKDDKNSLVLYVGDSYLLSGNYVRIEGDSTVFVTAGFSDVFNSDYRDLSMNLISDETNIRAVDIQSDQGETTLTSDQENKWSVNGELAQKEKVNFYINDLKTLQATDIKKIDLGDVAASFTIDVKNNEDVKEAVFYNIGNEVYVHITNDPMTYTLPVSSIDDLKKNEADFVN